MGDTNCYTDGEFASQYHYGTFAGYGVSVDHGSKANAEADATACATRLSRETQTPYRVEMGVGSESHPYTQLGYFVVEEFPECRADAVFDSWIPSANEKDAKACAQALAAMTSGQDRSFAVIRVPGLLIDSWKTVETSTSVE